MTAVTVTVRNRSSRPRDALYLTIICLESIPASLTHLVRALIGPAGAAPRRLRARDEEALDRPAGVRHPLPGTPSHHLDGTIQYVRPCSATGTFMEPSDKRTWIGAVLMGGRKSELIINCC